MIRKPDQPSPKTSSTSSAGAERRPKTDPQSKSAATGEDRVHGEGNYAAAREFNEAERKFVASGKVAAAARAAAPATEAEQQAMAAAEAEGKRRAKP